MQETHFLQYMVMFLAAAVVAVAVSKRAGLGAVLGYLGAGVLIGPHALGLAPDMSHADQFSELGVILLLFVIGLELSPARLWTMRRAVFGAGLLQVLLSALLLCGVAYYFDAGKDWPSTLVVGLALALSSTAIGLQTLAERKEIGAPHGRLAFAILLFQDLAAIPILAIVPLLGAREAAADGGSTWLATAKAIGMIAAVVIGGRYLLRPAFRIVAATNIAEVFTALALLVVFGAAWLMELAGMQMSLGAFLAGVLLANSEYRYEVEAQIEPFKGLLLGLFFVGVGISLDLTLLRTHPLAILAIVATLFALKGLVLAGIGKLSGKLAADEIVKLALVLAGGGEFAFVVLKLAQSHNLLEPTRHNLLVAAVTLSMALTPLLVIAGAKVLGATRRKPERAFDAIGDDHPRAIIAGYGRTAQIIARVLRAQKIRYTVLESSAEQVDFVRRFSSSNIYFGDSSRPELLRAAGAEKAEVFVLTSEDPEQNIRTARIVKRVFPHLKIVACARNRQHVFRLMDLNPDMIVRETFHSSLVMAARALEDLGVDAATARAHVDKFRRHDEQLLHAQYLVYDDETALLQTSREALAELDQLFAADDAESEGAPAGLPSAKPAPNS